MIDRYNEHERYRQYDGYGIDESRLYRSDIRNRSRGNGCRPERAKIGNRQIERLLIEGVPHIGTDARRKVCTSKHAADRRRGRNDGRDPHRDGSHGERFEGNGPFCLIHQFRRKSRNDQRTDDIYQEQKTVTTHIFQCGFKKRNTSFTKTSL